MKLIAFIAAGIFIFFGVLFIWGAFSPQGSPGWILIGLITIGLGFVLIWAANRKKVDSDSTHANISYKIEMPANTNLDSMKCNSCGGSLSINNIQMVAGAPIVNCPYCHTTYQLTEEPKW